MNNARPVTQTSDDNLITDKANKRIRAGFIGRNPGIHWASTAHIPALKALPNDYVVVGVANTSLASAQKAAEAFGLPAVALHKLAGAIEQSTQRSTPQ